MTIYFEGSLTARDCKRHIPHPVTVPEGSGQIDIDLYFEPAQAHNRKNMLTLTLFDANGFRGAGHRGGNRHQVSISATKATPGYLPGALPTPGHGGGRGRRRTACTAGAVGARVGPAAPLGMAHRGCDTF